MQLFASLLLLSSALTSVQAAPLTQPVQTYFVPLDEVELFKSFKDLYKHGDTVSGSVNTDISIGIASDNTIVYYDHQEDGYDSHANDPALKQSTTQIWGDGDLTNGVAPGTDDDILKGGHAIVLSSRIDPNTPPNATIPLYNGADRIQATIPIAVTRSAFCDNPGSLMAGAVECFNMNEWGKKYIAPIGVDLISDSDAWEYSEFYVMAGSDNTVIYLNGESLGNPKMGGEHIFNTGQSLNFTVNVGDEITASRPIQAHLITGDIDDTYEMRWYSQSCVESWSTEYYSPTAETGGATGFWFYNANDKSITIKYEGGFVVAGEVTVAPKSTSFLLAKTDDAPTEVTVQKCYDDTTWKDINGYYCRDYSAPYCDPAYDAWRGADGRAARDVCCACPNPWNPVPQYVSHKINHLRIRAGDTTNGARYSGVKFLSTDAFYGLAQIDADADSRFSGSGQAFDWGFPMIPSTSLTSQALVGLGKGCTDQCTLATDLGVVGSRSVVWVTPVDATYVFVDYDGDGVFDYSELVGALNAIRLTDDLDGAHPERQGDYDMTGAIIAATEEKTTTGQPKGRPVKIAVIWGQDPARSFANQPQSLDLGTAILPLANPYVSKEISHVANPDGSLDSDGIVDQVGDVIHYIISISNVGFADLTAVDVQDAMIADTMVGPAESINKDGILQRGETWMYTGSYTVTTSDITVKGDGGLIKNTVLVKTAEFPDVEESVEVPIMLMKLTGWVKEDTNGDDKEDIALSGVTVKLRNTATGDIVETQTDSSGNYVFTDVQAGTYIVEEFNLAGYIDVKDIDDVNDNKISVVMPGDADSVGNNFIDEQGARVHGSVKERLPDGTLVGLPDVKVELWDLNGNLITSDLTDSNGWWDIKNVPPGNYILKEVNPAGYQDYSDYDRTADGDSEDTNKATDNTIGVQLVSGETDNRNDFYDEKIPGSVSGTVTSDAGDKLAGVLIELKDGSGAVVRSTTTASDGSYEMTKIPPGDYVIEETNPKEYPGEVSDQDNSPDGDEFDTETIVDGKIKVTVQSGENDTDNDFVDSNTGTIKGSVKDDKGEPIPGTLISLNLVAGNETVATTVTDAKGNYQFSSMKPGSYKLYEENLVTFPIDVSDRDTTGDGDPTDSDIFVDNVIGVVLTPRETDDGNDFVDSNKAKITGTVKNDDTEPLATVKIELTNADGSAVIQTTFTNARGEYYFDNLEPGDYGVKETNPTDYPADIADRDFSNDSDPTDSNADVDNFIGVRLQPGETDGGNDFIDGNNGSISGSVMDDNRSALETVTIELLKNGEVVATTSTSSDGLYKFSDIEPGTYQLREINPPGYTDVSDRDTTSEDATDGDTKVDNLIDVVLSPGEQDTDNDFVDSAKGSISGTVTDDSKLVLANVLITLQTQDGEVVATSSTDEKGNYLFSDVDPGSYFVLEKNPPGYPSNVMDKDTTPDGDLNEESDAADNSIAVVLQKGEDDTGNDFVDSNNGSISGTVKDDDGNPLSGVTLELKNLQGEVVQTVKTNPSGEYIFNAVEPGNYVVEETNPAGYPKNVSDRDEIGDKDATDTDTVVNNKVSVTLQPGEADVGNNFVDSNKGSISGQVTDDTGKFITKVKIDLVNTEGDIVATTTTDGLGKYAFNKIAPGDYFVVETNPDAYPSSVSDQDNSKDGDATDNNEVVDDTIGVTLQPGEDDKDNDFVDSNNGSISGSVKDDDGNPLKDVKVTLTDQEGKTVEVRTNVAGGYVFNDVEPGSYTVEEVNPFGYPLDISDGDDSNDGDANDADTTPDNKIKVTLTAGESDKDNNFVDSNKGSSSGTVTDDDDQPLKDVTITLLYPNGTVYDTTTTDSNGEYTFTGVPPDEYILQETNPPGYPDDISDKDTTPDGDKVPDSPTPDNRIPVTLTPGKNDTNNDFKDSNDGSITGTVKDDDGTPLVGVKIVLQNAEGKPVATTITNEKGGYIFENVEPGDYKVIETNPDGYPKDVSDHDTSEDGDAGDKDTTVDNEIAVTVKPGETDSGNDFVDSNKGDILGTVKDDNGNPIANVPIQLKSADGSATVLSTTTGADGGYSFKDLEPGNYTIAESYLELYPTDVSDRDTTPDGDVTDSDTTIDNMIGVTLIPGETDDGNDFVDSNTGSASGSVTDDNGKPIPGVPIRLTNPKDGSVLRTTTTNGDGEYVFDDLEPGDYEIVETNLPEYPGDVSDFDTTPDGDAADDDTTVDNIIGISISPGEKDDGNNFVDSDNGSISGSVKDDNGNPIVLVVLELQSLEGKVVATTVTDKTGAYVFEQVEPGDYNVIESELPDFPVDISDHDNEPEKDDHFDTDTTVDNKIGVSLKPGEDDAGNDFVDGNNGSISGSVKDDGDEPLSNVIITLTYPNGTVVATTETNQSGQYLFDNLEPDTYVLEETNPDGYPADLSDQDDTPDGDEGDFNIDVDNKITVTVDPGEKDDGNNFVDILASEAPSLAPSTPPITWAPITQAPVTDNPVALAATAPPDTAEPSVSPSRSPSMAPVTPRPTGYPTLPPSAFCKEVATPSCTLCAPYRSLDYCKPTESFPSLIQQRTSKFRNEAPAVEKEGYWFHQLEDKIAGYLLTLTENVPAPQMFCCVTNEKDLVDCLQNKLPNTIDGVVIKATNLHSSQGVYVLVEDPNESGKTLDLVTGMQMEYSDVVSALTYLQATKIIVEEFIGKTLPTEYKFHVVNGEVAAIDVIADRATDCPCYAVVDTEWNRLDGFGCFEPGGTEHVDADTQCTSIDVDTGRRKAGPVKKDLYICENVEAPSACVLKEMTELALQLGNRIGVYMRIDMFVVNNKVYVQEYTTNHMNGLRHCAAKMKDGCIDSCFLGRMWDEAGAPFGGAVTENPKALVGFGDKTVDEQCAMIGGTSTYVPKCVD